MITPCSNCNCVRAGWCKRVTYHFSADWYEEHVYCFMCSDKNQWEHYIRNKAREIYERSNPDDTL